MLGATKVEERLVAVRYVESHPRTLKRGLLATGRRCVRSPMSVFLLAVHIGRISTLIHLLLLYWAAGSVPSLSGQSEGRSVGSEWLVVDDADA